MNGLRIGLDERTLNKVPQVTLTFWIIKVLATTVGETAADLLATRLGLGLTVTSYVMSALFIACLCVQVRAKDYSPPLYWLTVVLISVVGTLVSDNLVDGFGISLVTTSLVFSAAMLAMFGLWYRSQRTLSIHSIVTRRRELYYWGAILFAFAMGTSVGDLISETINIGYGPTALVFAGLIALVAAARYALRSDAILTFWIAYIMTRPLGASIGDYLAKPHIAGGLGLGTIVTSLVFLAAILGLVAFLWMRRPDRLEAEGAVA